MQKYSYTTIGAILSILVLLVGFFGPWYTITIDSNPLGQASIDVGLLDTTISGKSDLFDSAGSLILESHGVDNTMYIALITIILAVVSLCAILGTIFELADKKTLHQIGELTGFATFILAIISIVYYIANTPETTDLSMVGINSGLGWGFYLFFVGAITLILTNLWSRIARPD